jgi:hypothetical protein
VGELEGDVDYRELLRSKGVTVHAVDDSSSMEEKADEEDVAEGIPVQGSTTGDVDPEQSAPVNISQHLPAAASRQHLLTALL